MNNRLKILCILLASVYLFIIGHVFGEQIYNMVKAEPSVAQKNTPVPEHFHRVVVDLRPKVMSDSISKPIINELTGKPVDVIISKSKARVFIDNPFYPTWIWVAIVLQYLVMLFIVFIIVYIPILTFKIIKSVIRDHIFDRKIIKRIRRIGYSTLFLFVGFNYFFGIEGLIAKKYISMQEYDIVDFDRKYLYLLFGIVILIFAEVLNISQKIKEEQDLTI